MSPQDFDALRQLGLLFAALALAASSVLAAARLAPIVLGKKFQPRTFRDYFFKDDGDVSENGFVMMMLSAAVLLAALLAVSVGARLMGLPFA